MEGFQKIEKDFKRLKKILKDCIKLQNILKDRLFHQNLSNKDNFAETGKQQQQNNSKTKKALFRRLRLRLRSLKNNAKYLKVLK